MPRPTSGIRPPPGARKLLAWLTEAAIPWAIATSGRMATAAVNLAALDVDPTKIPVITRDHVRYADPDLFLAAAERISTGDRTILGKVSKRGNRYLRVLFVQAAWVVLIKPKSWERHGLNRWIEAAKKRLHRNVLAIALANNSPALPGAFLRMGEPLKRADSTKLPPNPPERQE